METINIQGLDAPVFLRAIESPYDTQNVFDFVKSIRNAANYETLAQCFTRAVESDEGLHRLYSERFAPRYPTNDELLQNPANSFGRALGEHMIRNGITLDFQGVDTSSVAATEAFHDYVRNRALRVHDMLHVLVGGDTSPIGEGQVAAFQAAQYSAVIHTSIVAFITMHVAFLESQRLARWTHLLNEALTAGQRATPFLGVPWELHMAEDLVGLRNRFKIAKLSASGYDQRHSTYGKGASHEAHSATAVVNLGP